MGEYMTLGTKFYILLLKQDVVAAPITSIFSSLFLQEAFITNIIIILCINYIIILCINENNSIINNNYGTLQDLILLFKISRDMCKDFFEIYI
jgi:hypothetical protein